jgi:hypothetical protein
MPAYVQVYLCPLIYRYTYARLYVGVLMLVRLVRAVARALGVLVYLCRLSPVAYMLVYSCAYVACRLSLIYSYTRVLVSPIAYRLYTRVLVFSYTCIAYRLSLVCSYTYILVYLYTRVLMFLVRVCV